MSNIYESDPYNSTSLEQVILAEEIEFTAIKDLKGKFFMKSMTPSIDTTEIIERNEDGYQKTNYIVLNIPAYLLLSFMDGKVKQVAPSGEYCLTFDKDKFVIPKGTAFVAEFLSGFNSINHLSIIGRSYHENKEE